MDLPVSMGFTKLCIYIIFTQYWAKQQKTVSSEDDLSRAVQLILLWLVISHEPVGAIEYINKEVNVKNLIGIIGSCIGPSNLL